MTHALIDFLAEQRRVFDESKYDRVPKQNPTGGQFAAKSGGSKTAPKKAATKQASKRAPEHQSTGDMAYDPDTGRGPGYGMADGDSRVKGLQTALNRLGLTDSRGRKLAVDGKLGPLTTQSIKAAQRRMGVTADGRVTPPFLEIGRAHV